MGHSTQPETLLNTTQLIQRLRLSAFIEDTAVDWPNSVLLNELYDRLIQSFAEPIVSSKQGYLLKTVNVPVVAGTAIYRLPPRAVTGGLQRLQIAYDNTLNFVDIDEVDETTATIYEQGTGGQDAPIRYVMRADNIVLLPTPNSSAYTLRLFYYLRPSRPITPQSSTTVGQVSSTTPGGSVVVVNGGLVKWNDDNSVSSSVAIGDQVDIVSSYGWHEVRVISATVSNITGLTYVINAPAADMTQVQPFVDYLRPADQSEWPQIPDDFHRLLADLTAAKVLNQRSMTQKEEQLLSRCEGDLARFMNLLQPRVQDNSSRPIVRPGNLYRGSWRGLWKWPGT